MRSLGLFSRLAGGLALLVVTSAATSGLALSRLATMDAQVRRLDAGGVDAVTAVDDLASRFAEVRRLVLWHAVSADAEGKADYAGRIADQQALIREAADAVEAAELSPDAVAAVTGARTAIEAYLTTIDEDFLPKSTATFDAATLVPVMSGMVTTAGPANEGMAAAVETVHAQADRITADAGNAYRTARTALVVAVLVGTALAVGVAVVLVRSLGRSGREMRDVAVQLADASDELGRRAASLAAAAEQTASQSHTVSAAAEQASANVSTVASATEELSASVQEIAGNTSRAAAVAETAAGVARDSSQLVARLSASSAEITKVVDLISSIAEETNLLALNATIEAARAGDAGKGFAVVAGEVKELAGESAKATDEITDRIVAIQGDAAAAAAAIQRIAEVITEVHGLTTNIASAVEEQAVTTSEIGRNVAEAAGGTSAIAGGITGVAEAAVVSTTDAHATEEAARALSAMAERLRAGVAQFRY